MDDLDMQPGEIDTDHVDVRVLTDADLDWVVAIDAQRTGRTRRAYFKLKIDEAVHNSGLRISLAARVGRDPAGFLIARLYYGEFGKPEPSCVLDSIATAPAFAGKKVARALLRQLETNLKRARHRSPRDGGRLVDAGARDVLPARRLLTRSALVSSKATDAHVKNEGRPAPRGDGDRVVVASEDTKRRATERA